MRKLSKPNNISEISSKSKKLDCLPNKIFVIILDVDKGRTSTNEPENI